MMQSHILNCYCLLITAIRCSLQRQEDMYNIFFHTPSDYDKRILGSLLSAHMLVKDPRQLFGDLTPEGYSNDLLHLAHDLAGRRLPAFENTRTGLPFPRCAKIPDE